MNSLHLQAFIDFKNITEQKAREIYVSQKKTGVGEADVSYDTLSPFKERILTLLGGPEVIEGERVGEFGVSLQYFSKCRCIRNSK